MNAGAPVMRSWTVLSIASDRPIKPGLESIFTGFEPAIVEGWDRPQRTLVKRRNPCVSSLWMISMVGSLRRALVPKSPLR